MGKVRAGSVPARFDCGAVRFVLLEAAMSDWMSEEGGIPHKNGSVRFYLVGIEEGVHGYLGWFDMTDWDKGWDKVWKAAQKCRPNEDFQVLRHDQMQDLMRNVHWAFEEAMEDKDETTWLWWINHNEKKKGA